MTAIPATFNPFIQLLRWVMSFFMTTHVQQQKEQPMTLIAEAPIESKPRTSSTNTPRQIVEHRGKNRHERRRLAAAMGWKWEQTPIATNQPYRAFIYVLRDGEAIAVAPKSFNTLQQTRQKNDLSPLVQITRRQFNRMVA